MSNDYLGPVTTSNAPATIYLREYQPTSLPAETFTPATGELLWRHYGNVIDVTFPSPRSEGQWQLTSQGWVGQIPLTPEVTLALQPRFSLHNLFQMVAYAYRLRSFHFLQGVVAVEELAGFYERLAVELARRVMARSRQGLHQAYVDEEQALPYVRGKIDVRRVRPWDPRLTCRYEVQTTDNVDNQIIAWTLHLISRGGLCSELGQRHIERAARSLQGQVRLVPVGPEVCQERLYNRLNGDYQAIHALCRFFLEHSGPGHNSGKREMVPFLVNMARLYELFVAEWLQQHLPDPWSLKVQERVAVQDTGSTPAPATADLHFTIDLTLYDASGAPQMVLDTKYKEGAGATTGDISQIVTYAQLKGCHEAVLIYPTRPAQPLDVKIGNVRVRTLAFAVDKPLESAGKALLAELGL